MVQGDRLIPGGTLGNEGMPQWNSSPRGHPVRGGCPNGAGIVLFVFFCEIIGNWSRFVAIERHFIGWKTSPLDAVVRLLDARYRRDRTWDMGHVVVVVPGGRVQRRLLEALVVHAQSRHQNDFLSHPKSKQSNGEIHAAGPGSDVQPVHPPLLLVPPRVVTIGRLADVLSMSPEDGFSPVVSLIARMEALKALPSEVLAPLAPTPPSSNDLSAWMGIAAEIEALDDELDGEGIGYAQVLSALEEMGIVKELERWRSLSLVRTHTAALLAAVGLRFRSDRWREALEQGAAGFRGDIVFVATPDAPRIVRELCLGVAERCSILSLIQAPASLAEGFDALGFIRADYWGHIPIPFDDSRWRIAADEAAQAFEIIDALAERTERRRSDEVTIGVGDTALMPTLTRILEARGLDVHPSVGRKAALASPALLLDMLAEFIEGRRLESFAALVRHPDMESYLVEVESKKNPTLRKNRSRWLTVVDSYAQEHLPLFIGDEWPSAESSRVDLEVVRALASAIDRLGPEGANAERPLSQWGPEVARILGEVYGHRILEEDTEEDAEIISCLEILGDLLRELHSSPVQRVSHTSCSFSTAVHFLLSCLRGRLLPPAPKPGAVELLGWLELLADDAPCLVVCGFNEGIIPSRVDTHAFLTDTLRERLGLEETRRRYARDAYVFRTLVESRESLTLVSARKAVDGTPLVPSRLLLTGEGGTIARRIQHYFEHTEEPVRLLMSPGTPGFSIPPPSQALEPLDMVSVTGIKDYLACPYRFYLRHVLHLRPIEDGALEMDARLFGIVAHDVLKAFGEGPLRGSEDADGIEQWLNDALERIIVARFGRRRRPAIDVQLHQLRRRFKVFAHWQARRNAAGWRIHAVEKEASMVFQRAAGTMTVIGRLDRIDRHENGMWQILDYKLGDAVVPPDKRHRRRVEGEEYEWVDLQLPLYHRLAESMGIQGHLSLGYIALSREMDRDELLLEAEWDGEIMADAYRTIDGVIDALLACRYWPPNPEPPAFSEDFAGICMDRCVEVGQGSADGTHSALVDDVIRRLGEPHAEVAS